MRIYNILVCLLVLYIAGQLFYNYTNLLLNLYNNIIIRAPYDVSEFNQAMWNTAKGSFFKASGLNLSVEAILSQKNFNVLASHWNVLILFSSLFYLILPHLASFIIAHCLSLGLSSTVVFLIAKEMLSEKKFLPLLILFIYSQYYVLTSIAYFLHPLSFSMLFLFLTLYFYIKDDFKFMVLFSIISIFGREEISLLIALLGLVSFFIPKRRKYSLFLFVLGILAFVIIKAIMAALFTPYEEWRSIYDFIKGHYGYLGDSFWDKIRNIFVHPSLIIQNISQPQKTMLYRDVFGLLSYLPFLSPLYLFPAMLIFVGLMLSVNPTMGVLDLQPWYYCLMLPFILLALIGAVEKIYNIDKFSKIKLPNNKLIAKIAKFRIVRFLSVILILLLLFNIYTKNAGLTRFKNNEFQNNFEMERYWNEDTFGVISAIKGEAKVVCSARLMPMLSTRRKILELFCLAKEVVDKGIYDIVLITEDELNIRRPSERYKTKYIETYKMLMNAPNYKNIYSTPFLRVFIKDSTSSLPLDSWKFNLISKIKTSSINSNYIFSNFADYSTILENAGVLDPTELVNKFYQNTQVHYATLEPKEQLAENIVYFVSDKPLETGYGYVLVLSAQSSRKPGVIRTQISTGDSKKITEITIDNKLRLYALPFVVTKPQRFCEFLLAIDQDCNIKKPVLLRFPLENLKDITNSSILETKVNNYKLSYNPWLAEAKFKDRDRQHYQFLVKNINCFNPLILFMKLLNFNIPLDLYQYSWNSDYQASAEFVALKY